jgi:alkanesulfonate monooxygenase SsuD/methylene tetrahydromethanopterin reductase-like flavin-dependent oxidoreductase (luciferase family)
MSKRHMHLMGYVIAGPTWHHNGAWRHVESDAVNALDATRYEHIARVLEGGRFDGLFFVDTLALMKFYDDSFAVVVRNGGQIYMLEPLQLLATMARATDRIGLSATMSTAFYPPFHIARSFATLDHISKGRAAWNIVTSTLTREAQNFGLDAIMDPERRYDHADEVVQACCKLWESWEPGRSFTIVRTASTRIRPRCATQTSKDDGSARGDHCPRRVRRKAGRSHAGRIVRARS